MAQNPEDDRHVRPFADTLREIQRGALHDELGEKLADVVTAVEETGKSGTLTMTITIKPMAKENTDAILVSGKVVAKKPVTPAKPSIFFSDNGNLVRDDPNQMALDVGLRDVSAEPERDARQRAAGSDA